MIRTPPEIKIDSNDRHLENAYDPMCVTVSGIVIDWSDVQLQNANLPMKVIPAPSPLLDAMVTDRNDGQPKKALCPIEVTLLPGRISTVSNVSHLENCPSSMVVVTFLLFVAPSPSKMRFRGMFLLPFVVFLPLPLLLESMI